MKWWIYGIGLALLPVAYVATMHLTGQPVEWPVLALIALIVAPIIVFRKKIGAMERRFDAMSGTEQAQAVARAAAKVAGQSVGPG